MTILSAAHVIKPISLTQKHDFIAITLADKTSRNKRRPALTAFDGAVLSVIVTHTNTERGYAFIGTRAIAAKIGASRAGVSKSICKLKDLEILQEVDGGKSNRAARLAPNWMRNPDFTAHGKAIDSTVHGIAEDETAYCITGDAPSIPMAVDETVSKRTRKEANGTGRASLARAAASPEGLGGSRSARPYRRRGKVSADQMANDLLRRRKARKNGDTNQ